MCGTCGCGTKDDTRIRNMQTGEDIALLDDEHARMHAAGIGHHHDHDHPHDEGHTRTHDHHSHDHAHGHGSQHSHEPPAVIILEAQILAKNNVLAERNRGWFEGREILALNLVSSPGAGKTTLLERTIRDLAGEIPISVIEGDQATAIDGERIRAAGADAVQVNTGAGCHLEADMVSRGLAELKPPSGSVVMIENVGNLVCPAMFDLGERAKIVILSVTEGEDKPIKYPHMFAAAKVMVLNKIDLLPHLDYDVEAAVANARTVNPAMVVLRLSARTGEGMAEWYQWLRAEAVAVREAAFA